MHFCQEMALHTFGWELCTSAKRWHCIHLLELCIFAKRWNCIHLVGSFALSQELALHTFSWKLCTFAKRKHCIHFVGSFVLLTRDGTTYITFIWKLWTFVKRWHCTHLVGSCVLLPRDSTAFIKLEALHFCQEMALHTFSWELYTFLIFPRDGTAFFGWDL